MPIVDGYAFIRTLRESANGANGSIPAIALTAYATDDDRARSLAAGFQVHVAKPIEPEALVKELGLEKTDDRAAVSAAVGKVFAAQAAFCNVAQRLVHHLALLQRFAAACTGRRAKGARRRI